MKWALLVAFCVFVAIVVTCLRMAGQADTQPLIDQMQQSVSGIFGGAR